ncbi:MAG: hypothetical protein E6I76_05550, partial [Chloroflexi bacterium]
MEAGAHHQEHDERDRRRGAEDEAGVVRRPRRGGRGGDDGQPSHPAESARADPGHARGKLTTDVKRFLNARSLTACSTGHVLWTATGARGSEPAPSTLALVRRLARSPLLRIAGTVVGIVLLARSVDLRSAAVDLGSAHRGWLAAGVALAAGAFLTAILEWGVWLRAAGGRVTWGMVTSWQAQSVFLSSLLPTGAGGDALRAVEAVRATGIGRGLASLVGSRL